MSHRRIAAILATLVATVALPATASAKSQFSVKDANAQVSVHVAKADKAIKRLARGARLGDVRSVESQLKVARSQTAAASKLSRRMANKSSSPAQDLVSAQALTLAGIQYDKLIETITAIVDQVTGRVQATVAGSIVPSIAGKQQIIAMLTSMMDDVPASAQATLAAIIAGLSVGDATEIVNLDQALQSGNLPVNISGIVTQALSMATSVIDSAFAMVQSLVPTLPVAIQGPLMQVLTMVTATVGTLLPSVLSSVTELIDSLISSLPLVGNTSATGGLGGLGNLGGLLSSIIGGGGGSSSLPGNVGGILDGLLGNMLGTGGGTGGGSSPVAGLGGIVGTVTSMISGLMNGFLGGLIPST